MKKLIISILFLATITAHAQPAIQWQNTIGGSGDDYLESIQQTGDGGYILGGRSSSDISGDKTENSQGVYDYWVVKLDTSGAIQWQNTIGGSDNDALNSIQQTSDGGYVLGGTSRSGISGDKTENSQGGDDYWVVKLDTSGAIQWQNTIGGSSYDYLLSIQQTGDGGYVLGGTSDSDISGDKTENNLGGIATSDYWVVKLDASGAIQWENTIGGSGDDILYSIQQTGDGGYVLGGYSTSDISGDKTENSQGPADYWVVKLDTSGAIQWQNTIGGSDGEVLYSIQQTGDGGYVLGGYSWSSISGDKTENGQGGADYWVVKIDASGAIQWQNTIGGSADDYLLSIQQTGDGGYVLGGTSLSNISGDKTEISEGGLGYWVVKIDASGAIQWQNTIGGSSRDYLRSIQQTGDGGYILGGYSESGISWDKTENSEGGWDYWVVKLGPDTITTETCNDGIQNQNETGIDCGGVCPTCPTGINQSLSINNQLKIYPNPNPGQFTLLMLPEIIKTETFVYLYNVLGEVIYENDKINKPYLNIDISDHPKGIYFVKVISGDEVFVDKIISQ